MTINPVPLVAKSQKRKRKDNISREEVAVAVEQFENKGGLIKRLPDQPEIRAPWNQVRVYDCYENVVDWDW